MSQYFLSAHASVNAQHSIAVPDKCTVYFYVPQNQILTNTKAFQLFNQLAQNQMPKGVNHKFTSGEFIPNYNIWNLAEHQAYSGVFSVGTDHPSIQLTKYTEHAPLTLVELFKMLKDPTALYWVACA